MNPIISLGGNCCITYQLIKYNLRHKAYPFDWTKISLNQLINVLENGFTDYCDTIKIKKFSSKHENTLMLNNIYNIKFAHEITNAEELNNFISSKKRQVERFINLKGLNIFIRIELEPIKSSYENKIIKLLDLLNKYSNNFILKLIINSNIEFKLPSNVKIYRFNNFSYDWKMEHIDWSFILSNN